MKKLAIQSIASLFVVCAIGGGAWVIWHAIADRSYAAPATQPSRVSTQNGETIISLSAQEELQSNIQIEPLEKSVFKPEFVGYGTLMEHPAASLMLRAPFAGTLRLPEGNIWPTIGDAVRGTVAFVDPRYTPMEHVDVISRLTSAEADVTTASSALAAARSEYEADVKLNALNKNVSDRTVQDARAAMEQQAAKLESATQTVSLLQKALAATTQPATSSALSLKKSWQVAEVGARPGENVDAGQMILRLANWHHLIATVGLPSGENIDPNQMSVRLFVEGQEARPLQVTHTALAPSVDPKTLGETFVIQVVTGAGRVRPGAPVAAVFTPAGKGQEGVLVQQNAVVWHDGKAWVYVAVQPHQFTRRAVSTETPWNSGWFIPLSGSRLKVGDQIVVQGAQQLLSEEFKPVLPAGGDVDDD
ncbi:MAG: efflux RND transporter periplasmic adaptor subunit [Phycisphaerae bacterium]